MPLEQSEKAKWTYELKRKATWTLKIKEPKFDFETDMWSLCLKEEVGVFSLFVNAKFPHPSWMEKSLHERPQGMLPSNTIPNPQEDSKVITTQSGATLAGPSVPPHPLI
nr:hypothetical protein [Tanacetum cinerariifolium]